MNRYRYVCMYVCITLTNYERMIVCDARMCVCVNVCDVSVCLCVCVCVYVWRVLSLESDYTYPSRPNASRL
jgi:hypothetical protein